MSCPCGNHALKARAAKQTQQETSWELQFSECDRCGRIGFERLNKNGVVSATGAEARARFQIMQDNPIFKYTHLLEQSWYRPYKLWTIGDKTLRVCLIKLKQRALAFCPELKLAVEGIDYLDTAGELQQQVCHALGNHQDRIIATDTTPFPLAWGTDPSKASVADTPRKHQNAKPSDATESTPKNPESTASPKAPSAGDTPGTNTPPGETQFQLDLFT